MKFNIFNSTQKQKYIKYPYKHVAPPLLMQFLIRMCSTVTALYIISIDRNKYTILKKCEGRSEGMLTEGEEART